MKTTRKVTLNKQPDTVPMHMMLPGQIGILTGIYAGWVVLRVMGEGDPNPFIVLHNGDRFSKYCPNAVRILQKGEKITLSVGEGEG